MDASATARVVGFTGTAALSKGPETWAPQLEELCCRSYCYGCSCHPGPWRGVLLELGRQSHVPQFPSCIWVPWNCRLSCHGWAMRVTGTASALPLLLPPPCSSPPTLGVQMCGSLQHPGVWGRETFVELWKFYCCRLKEEKQSVSCHYDADVMLTIFNCIFLWY